MDKVKKKLGFGCMRLPMRDGGVDEKQFCKMADRFLEEGFNYFDTAHGYLGGLSEKAIKKCLTSRHKRQEYLLTDKLTEPYFKSQKDIRPFFESQLELCGVDYFDFYLMHAQGSANYDKFQRCEAYETAFELKKEGKIRHVGISFHDTAQMLEKILSDYPQIEVVQIQLNYLDYNDSAIQSRKVYEVCRKHNKPVIVMEPVKGGNLVNLPVDAAKVLDELKGGSRASYAIRYAAGFEGMLSVLSGMSTIEQLEDNISYMKDFKPLDEREISAINKVVEIIHSEKLIACTACRYCTDGCPKKIFIPDLFSCMNTKKLTQDWNPGFYYSEVYTKQGGKASECIKCGKCEKVCPQHLPIRSLLEDVAKEFE
ncbi:MAG: aldo/keto reductase [Firmicutes bacterium]|nr:aldo/keto reductase [Bacillota bacterium]